MKVVYLYDSGYLFEDPSRNFQLLAVTQDFEDRRGSRVRPLSLYVCELVEVIKCGCGS